MKLSLPIYDLKRRARKLSRAETIPLHAALDLVAAGEGLLRWSLLSARAGQARVPELVYAALKPGDLLLVGARPGQGKTVLCLELAVQAMKAGHRAAFFSLDYTLADLLGRFKFIGEEASRYEGRFAFDNSDGINAGHVIAQLSGAKPGTLIVIDYLQALDQRRDNPALDEQVRALRAFARERGLIMAFISQIDRHYDAASKPCPELRDVRLPNPLDLALFDRTCFLQGGQVAFSGTV